MLTGCAPVLRLCRELVQAGFEPSSPLEAYRGDLLCLRARSIGEAAKMEVTTSDTGRPVFVARVDTQAGLAQDRYRLAPDTTMTTAHLYLFSDACPSDWLVDGQDDVWHTVVNLVFQSDPGLYSSIEQGQSHEKVLLLDPLYVRFINQIQSQLPSGRLHKWKTGPSYRERFCRALMAAQPEFKPLISACSFQEMTLWASKAGLLADYNRRVGGIEGRGIGFEEFTDDKGRRQMKHSFLNFHGLNDIQGPEHQMLVLLLMAWFVADQYRFYFRDIVNSRRYGFDQLQLSVVSDKLSGDDDFRRKSEQNLRHLIDPEHDGAPVTLTRSEVSDTFSGDLLVDNLAGWLTAAMSDPCGVLAGCARELIPTGIWTGWHHLQPSTSKLERLPAIERLLTAKTDAQSCQ